MVMPDKVYVRVHIDSITPATAMGGVVDQWFKEGRIALYNNAAIQPYSQQRGDRTHMNQMGHPQNTHVALRSPTY